VALSVLTPSLLDSECRYIDGEATFLLQTNYIRFMQIGQVILTMKCADGLLLLAEEETVLQGMV